MEGRTAPLRLVCAVKGGQVQVADDLAHHVDGVVGVDRIEERGRQ